MRCWSGCSSSSSEAHRLLLQAGWWCVAQASAPWPALAFLAAVALKRRTAATPLDEQQRPVWS